jgi:uncharacterized membrane protein YkoI
LEEMMNQRMALLLASALTAFVLVLMCGVAATVAVFSYLPTTTHAQPAMTTNSSQPAAQPVTTVNLTPQQAAAIAQTTAPRTRLTSAPELVNYNGVVAYEVVLDRGTIYVDANNGKVLANGTNAPSANRGRERHEEHEEEEEEDDD